jgi:ComF family protein
MWKTVLDLFLPINCLGCAQEGQFLCPDCFEQIPLNRKQPLILYRNKQKSRQDFALTGLITASYYNHPLVKQAIHCYKYNLVQDLAKPLGQLMARQLIISNKQLTTNSLLIPVPLHKRRLRWRGFNQAELLALEVSRRLNIAVVNNILIRTKHRLPQVNIKNSQERKENIRKVFQLNPNFKNPPLKNKTIILVDDVSTTSATLEECGRVLKPLKPKEIWGLVVARG